MRWAFVVLPAVSLFAAFCGAGNAADDAHPDRAAMRAYRIGHLTDQQLIDLKARSDREFETAKDRAKAEGKKFWEDRSARRKACEANPAQKLRDPDHCFEPLPIGHEDIGKPLPDEESPEVIFEGHIMGNCGMARSVAEAKQMECLPP